MSKDARSAVKNSAASIVGQVTNLLVGLISSVYVARVLGREQFGIYSWALGLTVIVVAVAHAGLDNVIMRDVARQRTRAPEYLLSSFVAKTFTSAICYLGVIAYFQSRGYAGMQLAVGYILCSTVITESFNASCRAVLVGLERQDAIAVVSVLTNAIRVGIVVLLVSLKYDIVAVAWVTVLVMIAMLITHLAIVARLTEGVWRARLSTIKHLFAAGSSFLVLQILTGVFDRADYLMLDYYKGVAAVGIYSAAYRIIEIVMIIGYNASLSLFPIMARRARGSKEDYARAVERSVKYLTVFGTPFCVGISLLSYQLMVGLYGQKFAAAGPCLTLLIWSRIACFAILPLQQAVAARDAQASLIPPMAARAVMKIGLNIYLIPLYGFIGASVAMIIAENVYYVLNYFISFRGPERFNPITLYAKPVLGTAVMAAAVIFLRRFGILPATIGGIAVYAAMLPVLRILDSEDKRILASVYREFRGRNAGAA